MESRVGYDVPKQLSQIMQAKWRLLRIIKPRGSQDCERKSSGWVVGLGAPNRGDDGGKDDRSELLLVVNGVFAKGPKGADCPVVIGGMVEVSEEPGNRACQQQGRDELRVARGDEGR